MQDDLCNSRQQLRKIFNNLSFSTLLAQYNYLHLIQNSQLVQRINEIYSNDVISSHILCISKTEVIKTSKTKPDGEIRRKILTDPNTRRLSSTQMNENTFCETDMHLYHGIRKCHPRKNRPRKIRSPHFAPEVSPPEDWPQLLQIV